MKQYKITFMAEGWVGDVKPMMRVVLNSKSVTRKRGGINA